MRYLSVCSGIEAATVAWHDLGWTPAAFSEIEAFPSAVLAHHYPETPNLGDMTKFKEWNIGTIDLLVGGTPCQSFSVAGLRKGLEDPRGNLALVYCGILDHFRPRWFVWENVPGVLSSNGGRDFGSFLGALAQLGYGFAYRVLDAQWFGVAQRRRRVFVVGCLGDWRPAAAVLFERQSLRRDTAPSREARKATANSTPLGLGPGGELARALNACKTAAGHMDVSVDTFVAHTLRGEGFDASEDGTGRGTPLVPVGIPEVMSTLLSSTAGISRPSNATTEHETYIPMAQPINIYGGNKRPDRPEGGFYIRMDEDTSKTLDAASGLNPTCSQGGTAVMQPMCFQQNTRDEVRYINGDGQIAGELAAENGMKQQNYVAQPIAVDVYNIAPGKGELKDDIHITDGSITKTLDASGSNPAMHQGGSAIVQTMAVRRLTPVECERLQGFPDNYTAIPWRGKAETPDGPRYKALGNSMAVPVMRWIGKRIHDQG